MHLRTEEGSRRRCEPDHVLHAGDQMLARLDVVVYGPSHDVDITLRVRVRYDESRKWETISVEPDDLGLFRPPRARHGAAGSSDRVETSAATTTTTII